MDCRITDGTRERLRRPVRNKRYNRRAYTEEKRPPKRLFTPEIKRFLKDWLVRRRENPYPNRDEKKSLAVQTGLTYIQVCNWFANWRRKLKNSGKEAQRKSWGFLIKSYNTQVHGNIEHFSICSEDSIWQEGEINDSRNTTSRIIRKYNVLNNIVPDVNDFPFCNKNGNFFSGYKSNISEFNQIEKDINEHLPLNNNFPESKYFTINETQDKDDFNSFTQNTSKYKNHIMEKYLRDCKKPQHYINNLCEIHQNEDSEITRPSIISKWLESAANFIPNENNYLNWTLMKSQKKRCKKSISVDENVQQHGKEELDAAEALTTLANIHATVKL